MPRELEVQITPAELVELIAYQSVKADAIERAKVKAAAKPVTAPARKAKMGSQRKGTA